ncbi:uncharacterized protein AKAW2_30003A [Aspergillus luchuensis]|uniref:Uncharacterized protein n=1 Tax=Aspergillus kawachii TaxID=1069201 RepID=A0A7R7W618_ASPKA|nr:uncharacterized protein AKAW2_30003A [Aspergillus luchuensis]BCR96684.1 hypothetical protein AKAW2_30003A [Aspergillus luchuensis]BCS09187.1 hypothetical protein ALUC_30004A [Aspergillus luchuensis]
MRVMCEPSLPLRDQILANLRFLFGNNVDFVTCNGGHGNDVAVFAYKWGIYGEWVKVMQALGPSWERALRKLLDFSSRCVQDFLPNQVMEDLQTCHISLPQYIEESNTF